MSAPDTSLLDRYNALAVPDQTVLQALAILYEPASPGVVASCLGGANCRESHLRAFTLQTVAVRLARLAKVGLAEALPAEGKTAKARLWQVNTVAAELAVRHAVREGTFKSLARSALEGTRGKDWLKEGAGESPRRTLHIAFHYGDWAAVLRETRTMDGLQQASGGLFVRYLIENQPDDGWYPPKSAPHVADVFSLCLHDAFIGLENPASIMEVAEKLHAAGVPGLADCIGSTYVLQGKFRDAERLARAVDEESACLIRLFIDFAQGDDQNASNEAAVALTMQRRRLGSRDQLLEGWFAFWQTLAMLRAGTPEMMERLDKALDPAAFRSEANAAELLRIHASVQMRLGHAYIARQMPQSLETADNAEPRPLLVLLHGLAALWLNRQDPGLDRQLLTSMQKRAKAAGYRWFASQLAGLARRYAGEEDNEKQVESWPLLVDAFRNRDEWRRGLSALKTLAETDDTTLAITERRVAWLLTEDQDGPNPYCPFGVRPVEQTLSDKSGQWSKGRNISLKRLYQNSSTFDYANEQDRMVFSTLRFSPGFGGSDFSFDNSAAIGYLVGHPLVYRDDASGAKVEVAPGKFELSAVEDDGGCVISLDPPLSEFDSAAGNASSDTGIYESGERSAFEPEIAARFETPTRLRVMRLAIRERRLARIIGAGLRIPKMGRQDALDVLGDLAVHMRIHSNLPELAQEGETVDADTTPRIHLIPLNPGLDIEIWVHPFDENGPAYRPGKGGKILSADIDGRTLNTVRDLDDEKQRAAEIVELCPALKGHQSSALSWRFDNPEDALTFMMQAGDLGDKVILVWPKGGRFKVKRFTNPADLGINISRNSDWLEFDGTIRIDEHLTLSMQQLLAAVRNSAGGFVRVGEDEYIAITESLRLQLADLESFVEKDGNKLRIPLLASGALEELEELGADLRVDSEWRKFLDKRKELADFTPNLPVNFTAELRDYQVDGFRWLARLAEWGAGACLADDMGLGKTIQALALLCRRASLGPAIVVAPTSVCHNWLSEAIKFAPALRPIPFGEGDRAGALARLGPGDLLIASYGLLQQETEMLSSIQWTTAVLDEAQAIKNVATKRSKAAMSLKADFRFITTGTPIENHLGELWNLFRFINPHLLGSWRRFQERFAGPIERLGDDAARERLRKVIRPFILRRSKSQVLSSLPPKTEITLHVEMDSQERSFYEALRRQALDRLSESDGGLEEKRFQILAEIMQLRRACCSPELITGNTTISSAKQEQFQQTLSELLDNNHKALVFSQFVAHLAIIRRYLDEKKIRYQYLDGSTPAKKRKQAVEAFQSGKGDVFLISLKAGGLGLNLTAADYVIHMDPWWNPAVEDQASDRAHRIGQTRPVTVYRLVAAGTIEDKIVELHSRKRDLAETLLSGADQSPAIDIEEIMRLLREDV